MRIDRSQPTHPHGLVDAEIRVPGFMRGGIQKKALIQLLISYGIKAKYLPGKISIPVRCSESMLHIIEFINKKMVPTIASQNAKSWVVKRSRRKQRSIVVKSESLLKGYLLQYIAEQQQSFEVQLEYTQGLMHKMASYFRLNRRVYR